jgi:outer membrane protein insertion porin family
MAARPLMSALAGVVRASFPGFRSLAILLLVFAPMRAWPAEVPDDAEQAALGSTRVNVSGLGWVENLRMRAVLRQLRPRDRGPVPYDANAIEDGAFLLLNHVRNLGFLDARIACELTDAEGNTVWESFELGEEPPPSLASGPRRVRFVVDPGRRYYYAELGFRGLTALPEDVARGYFVRSDGLLRTRVLRRFSPREMTEAVGALRSALQLAGHARAEVTVAELEKDPATGAVRGVIEVSEGPKYRARNVEILVREEREGAVVDRELRSLGWPYSRRGLEDLEQELLLSWHRAGYPDAVCQIDRASESEDAQGGVVVDLRAEVVRGPRVRLGTTRLAGPAAEEGRALVRKLRLEGPWLDRLAVDEARARLARWGAFRFVNVRYDVSAEDPGARDPVFELEPGRLLTVDVLAGFRSYDLLYGGVDVTRHNLLGLGHVAGLRLVQSFRSSEGYASYSIPDAGIDGLTVFGLVDALRREEVSFRREELRLSFGARRAFEDSAQQVGVRYNYEFLRAVDAPSVSGLPREVAGEEQPDVASVTVDWILDRRDSAVTPRKGFRLGVGAELARPEFGGEARFVRPELEASWHLPLGRGRYLGAGLRQTVLAAAGDDALVPFNKRIFPGGEDSVRGYQRGEAGSLNDAGEVIGSEAALVWNLEFEQQLTESWSVVTFVDGVGQSADLSGSWWDETLWSVGGGLRWNTVVGPVRVEYGYNLSRRDADPSGTLHFSVGFPF